MRFGPVPLEDAEGAIIAHGLRHAHAVLKKGTRLTAQHIRDLSAEGVTEVTAAVLDAADVHENEAARRVAEVLTGPNVSLDTAFTGRCNVHAMHAGLFLVDRTAIDALNRIDPGLTIATLPAFTPVEPGRMVATVKIIPFALPGSAIASAISLAVTPPVSVEPWRPLKVGLVATMLPSLKPTVMDKTRRILQERLDPAGAAIREEIRTAHDSEAVAGALRALRDRGADLLVVFGASAITDAADVVPSALLQAGGVVRHLGMPVDPGNLLLLGELDGVPMLGAPGCARSPVENGFDWILRRLLAGLEVTADDITGLGVGGLLMEIVSRPQPREKRAPARGDVAAIVLAAGQSSRMGGPNKLLALFDGEPLIHRTVRTALASAASSVVVVTGHREEALSNALAGLPVALVHNASYADGLSTSVRAGIASLPSTTAGALVILADMPGLTPPLLDALIGRFAASAGTAIVLPTHEGKRGNPVLWPSALFPELMTLSGDTGARHLLGAHEDLVERVEVGPSAALDVDTPEAMRAAGGIFAQPVSTP